MQFAILQNDLRDIFERLKLSINPNSSKDICKGIHFIVSSDGTLLAEAVDFCRVGIIRKKLEKPYPNSTFEFVVEPFKVQKLKILGTIPAIAVVTVVDGYASFSFTLTHETKEVPLLDGQFLNFHGTIPTDEPFAQILVNPKLLIDAVKILQSGDDPICISLFSDNHRPVVITNAIEGNFSMLLPVKWMKKERNPKEELSDTIHIIRDYSVSKPKV